MVNFRRNQQTGGTYFFTVTLRDRHSRWLVDHVDYLRQAMKQVRQSMPYRTKAIVILPEHLHAIWELPVEDSNYPARWRRIKTLFTQALLKEGVSLTKNKRGEYNLWQRRYWEHTIRDEKDFEQHVNYIHHNPVKHGLVAKVTDWPYSSFHYYVRHGILPNEWDSVDYNKLKGFGE